MPARTACGIGQACHGEHLSPSWNPRYAPIVIEPQRLLFITVTALKVAVNCFIIEKKDSVRKKIPIHLIERGSKLTEVDDLSLWQVPSTCGPLVLQCLKQQRSDWSFPYALLNVSARVITDRSLSKIVTTALLSYCWYFSTDLWGWPATIIEDEVILRTVKYSCDSDALN